MSINKAQARDWYKGICILHDAHYYYSKICDHRHYQLGVPTIILATIVGTSIFSGFADDENQILKIITGCLSLAAATLSALATFLRFKESGEKHKAAGARYGQLRREIEYHLEFKEEDDAVFWQKIIKRRNELDINTPSVPNNAFEVARKNIRERFKNKGL